ncbi:alpha/beta hydrolase-fold protein [Schlesneria sp.]|uniref:alpha/beta hydrolase-fold protein n=1 Tax=Schlesneria sp. TaxID=2762018 RepID=UPI002F1912FA
MSWSTTQVSGKSVDVFVPGEDLKPAGIVLFLHGYDGVTIKDNPAYSNELAKHNLIGLCPLGEHCWWTDVVYPSYDPLTSPLDYLSEHIPKYCAERWQIEPPRIGVCGVEMGGQGALQLAYRHARKFPAVVAISPKIDFETWWGHGTSLDTLFENAEAARQRTAILHLHPLNYPRRQLLLCDPADPYCFDGVLTLASKLSSTGIAFEDDFVTTHGGYGWNYANAMAPKVIDFLARAVAEAR